MNPIPNHLELVAATKRELVARGISLVGPCGAFEITRRVAWQLRAEGAGLLLKTTGNQCQNRAVDIVCYADGTIVDVLVDSGAANTPAWQVNPVPVDRGRFELAPDPGDAPAPPPPSPPPPAPPPAPPVPVVDGLEQLLELATHLTDAAVQIAEATLAIENQLAQLNAAGLKIRL